MSIRLAMGALAVCASVCVHASPVFTAGDVYWFSKKPMQLIEVTGGGSFDSSVRKFESRPRHIATVKNREDNSVEY